MAMAPATNRMDYVNVKQDFLALTAKLLNLSFSLSETCLISNSPLTPGCIF